MSSGAPIPNALSAEAKEKKLQEEGSNLKQGRDAELEALKGGRIKTTLFSADGKLISPSNAASEAEAAEKRKGVDAELQALRSNKVKTSIFSEDGKLLSTPRVLDEISEPAKSPSDFFPTSFDEPPKTEASPAPAVAPAVTPPTPKEAPKVETAPPVPATVVDAPAPKPAPAPAPAPASAPAPAPARVRVAPQPAPKAPATSPNKAKKPSLRVLDDYDDILDGAAPEDRDEELLRWSSEEPHSLSDWQIQVENEQEGTVVTYHVHKLILSTGPTKSEHYQRLFKMNPNETSPVSEVTLSSSAALAFPQMLDFMYSRQDEVEVNTSNAAALRHLGKFYGIRKLVVIVTTFIRDDLTAPKSLHYLNAAAEFDDEKVMSTSAQICASSILTVDRDGLTGLDPPLFSRVVSCDEIACTSEELSDFCAEFCRKHEEEMNADLLRVITHSKNMPTIDPRESVYLLQLSEKHEGNGEDCSDLPTRCIDSCSTAWNGILVDQLRKPQEEGEDAEEAGEGPYYGNLSPELKVQLLEEALFKAQTDCDGLESNKDETIASELSLKDDIIAAKDKTIGYMEAEKKEQDANYAHLKQVLAKFRRLPPDYSFPKKRNSTFHPMAATNPRFKEYGHSAPSAMPSQKTGADHTEAGYLFPGSGDRLWPVYYYKDA